MKVMIANKQTISRNRNYEELLNNRNIIVLSCKKMNIEILLNINEEKLDNKNHIYDLEYLLLKNILHKKLRTLHFEFKIFGESNKIC